jgi:hypothetical protein
MQQIYAGARRNVRDVATITVGIATGIALLKVDDTHGKPFGGICYRFGDSLGAAVQVLPGTHTLHVAGHTGVIEILVNLDAGAEYRIRRASGPDCIAVDRTNKAGGGPSPTACVVPSPLVAAVSGRTEKDTAHLTDDKSVFLRARRTVLVYTIDEIWGPNSYLNNPCYYYNSIWDSGLDMRLPPGRHVLEVAVPGWSSKPQALTHDFEAGKSYKLVRTKDPEGRLVVTVR